MAAVRGAAVKMAVIDSGIHPGHPHLRGVPVQGLAVVPDGDAYRLEPDGRDVHGHGTAVAAAIARTGVALQLWGIRVLDRQLRCDGAALAFAIEQAAARGAQVINLSLATARPQSAPRLERAVDRARGCGAWLVAAQRPGQPGWPGDLPQVLGAVAVGGCPPGACVPLGPRRFGAHGEARPPGGRPAPGNLAGHSLAAAHLSALVAAVLAQAAPATLDGLADRLTRRFGVDLPERGEEG